MNAISPIGSSSARRGSSCRSGPPRAASFPSWMASWSLLDGLQLASGGGQLELEARRVRNRSLELPASGVSVGPQLGSLCPQRTELLGPFGELRLQRLGLGTQVEHVGLGHPGSLRGLREQHVAIRQDQTYAPGRVAERASPEFRCFHGKTPLALGEPHRDSRARVWRFNHPSGPPAGPARVANEADGASGGPCRTCEVGRRFHPDVLGERDPRVLRQPEHAVGHLEPRVRLEGACREATAVPEARPNHDPPAIAPGQGERKELVEGGIALSEAPGVTFRRPSRARP